MSLQPRPLPAVPALTARVVRSSLASVSVKYTEVFFMANCRALMERQLAVRS